MKDVLLIRIIGSSYFKIRKDVYGTDAAVPSTWERHAHSLRAIYPLWSSDTHVLSATITCSAKHHAAHRSAVECLINCIKRKNKNLWAEPTTYTFYALFQDI